MSDKIVCDEEKIKEFYDANPENADALRMMMEMQQENIKKFVKPFVKYVNMTLDLTPDAGKKPIGKLMTIHAGTIAGNILLNMPEFDKEQFLKQLDEMIELRDKKE